MKENKLLRKYLLIKDIIHNSDNKESVTKKLNNLGIKTYYRINGEWIK